MQTKAVVIVIDDPVNFSKKRRPSWCQWGREMEGIMKESSFSCCVELMKNKYRPSWCQSGREMEGLWRKVVLVVLNLWRNYQGIFLFFGVLLFVRLCCTYESRTASVKRCLQDYALWGHLFFGGGNEKFFVILSHPQLHKSWLSSWWRSKFRTPRATPLSSTEFQAEAELDFKDWWGQSQNFVRGNYNLPSLDLALSQFSPQTSDCYIGPP